METKHIIAGVGILLTFAAAVWNLLYTFSATKKTRYINVVTTARIEWIERLRKDVSCFAGLAYHWATARIVDFEASRKIEEEMNVLRWQIQLQLNPGEEAHTKLLNLLNELVECTGSERRHELDHAASALISETQNLLKEGWEKVKREANGESKDPRTRLSLGS
jgi:hypothetical protein